MEKDDKDLCKACFSEELNMINTTCYHMALCKQCATDMLKKGEKRCPICRAEGDYKLVFKG